MSGHAMLREIVILKRLSRTIFMLFIKLHLNCSPSHINAQLFHDAVQWEADYAGDTMPVVCSSFF